MATRRVRLDLLPRRQRARVVRRPRPRDRGWWIAVINLAGSIAFGVSAVAGYIVPATGDYLDLAAANASTVVGALCFLAGALLLLVGRRAHPQRPSDSLTWRPHDPHPLFARPARACLRSPRRRTPRRRSITGRSRTRGLKKLGGVSSSKKLTLQLGLIANQSGLQKAVKAASNPASSSYGKYPSLSTLQSKYGASSSKRKGVVNAFKKQSIKATIDVTHLRATATVSIGKAKKLFGTKWAVYKAKSGAHVALPVNTPKAPSGIKGNVDTIAGHAAAADQRVVERVRRRHADAHRDAESGLHAGQLPAARRRRQRAVPEPDPHRVRDRAVAGGGGAGPGRAAGDRGGGADARVGRQRVPLLLRDAGDVAEDPQRRVDQADPRELAGRDGRLDGGAEAGELRSVGAPVERERRRRRRRGLPRAARPAAAGDDQRRASSRTSSRSPTARASRTSRRTPPRARSSSAS